MLLALEARADPNGLFRRDNFSNSEIPHFSIFKQYFRRQFIGSVLDWRLNPLTTDTYLPDRQSSKTPTKLSFTTKHIHRYRVLEKHFVYWDSFWRHTTITCLEQSFFFAGRFWVSTICTIFMKLEDKSSTYTYLPIHNYDYSREMDSYRIKLCKIFGIFLRLKKLHRYGT